MYFCTIINKPYVSYARVLAKSILALHPSAQIYVLLADRLDGCFVPTTEPFKTVFLEDLGSPDIVDQMSFYYTPFQFCCAVRGLFHNYMMQKTSAPEWIYLDSDILVTSDMSCAFEALQSASILLNPHNIGPAKDKFALTTEVSALRNGMFNGGFLGVRRCDPSAQFIPWFSDRLARFCFDIPGLFVDQLWLNHVPYYFPGAAVFTHAGANLAHWNLYQRTITRAENGDYLIDGQPLLFAHFSGWSVDEPGQVSKHAPHFRDIDSEKLQHWRELGERYRAALLENGILVTRQWQNAFERFDNGMMIKREMRYRQYHEYWERVPQSTSPFARADYFQDTSSTVEPTRPM